MNYFRMLDDMSSLNRWHVGEITLPDGSEPQLRIGVPLSSDLPLTATVHHEGPALEFSLTSFAVPIVTEKLAKVVQNIAGVDIQCLPLEIKGHGSRTVLNALRIVNCVDESRSEFTKWTLKDHRADLAGQYRSITKLVLDTARIPNDAHIFRLWGFRVVLIVSEKLREAMQRVGCKGAVFQDVTPPLN
ncbi:MAG: hypothetical protein IPK82_05290 [Polyangiaceae bacterium]|nr:hypothetical protein [Polyangiaceae bacterium]